MDIIRRFAYKKLGIIDYYEQIMNGAGEMFSPALAHLFKPRYNENSSFL